MKTNRIQTLLMVAGGILWLLMVGLAGAGHWLAALYVLLGLLLSYSVLGALRDGVVDLRLVAFPTGVWLMMWAAAFALGDYFAEAFAGRAPDFTILGFHPSFAAIIVLFWIVPTLLMGFGFEAMKDRWLSQERWDDFVRRVHDQTAENGEDEGGE
ncbi:MAG: hypothetical protein HKP03_05220 [Xanthomonadales bacterium]|nr:hypothetical protein [Xanthomonadales bacterium]